MAAKDASIQERTLAYFTRAVDVAKSVGATQVLVTSGWAYYNEPVETARERSATMLKQVARYAGEQGINLAIEALRAPESRIANTVADLKLLLSMVDEPALKVCLDIGVPIPQRSPIPWQPMRDQWQPILAPTRRSKLHAHNAHPHQKTETFHPPFLIQQKRGLLVSDNASHRSCN